MEVNNTISSLNEQLTQSEENKLGASKSLSGSTSAQKGIEEYLDRKGQNVQQQFQIESLKNSVENDPVAQIISYLA